MELLDLRYFVEIAENQSFTKAAEKLFISQPTLSRRKNSLEDEIGIKLFRRESHSVSLTDSGELFLEESRKILALSDGLRDKLYKSANFPEMKIGYPIDFHYDVLTNTIYLLSQKFPHTDITATRRGTIGSLNQDLTSGNLDVIVTIQNFVEDLPGVAYTKLFTGKRQIAVSARHLLADRKSIKMSELKNERFIVYDRSINPVMADAVTALCERAGFTPKLKYTRDDSTSMLLMVASGKGVAALSSMVNQSVHGVVFLDVDDENMEADVVFAYLKDNPNPLVPMFINEYKKLLKAVK